MDVPGGQTRVDEGVKCLREVILAADDVAAVAIDEGAELSFCEVVILKDKGPRRVVAHPQAMGMVPSPTTAHRLRKDAQLALGGTRLRKVGVEGGDRNGRAELHLEELVDRISATLG